MMFRCRWVRGGRFVVASIVSSLAVAACGSSSGGGGGASANSKTLDVPVILDETGAGSPYATRLNDGLQIGIQKINQAGGIDGQHVNLKIQDTTSSPTQTSTVMHSLAGGSDPFVMGELLSSDAEAAFPIAKSAGLPTILGTISDQRVVAASRPQAFTTFIPVQLLIPNGVKQWVAAKHPTNVAVVQDTTNDATAFQGKLVISSLQHEGVNVSKTISVSTGEPSYASQASQVASLNPSGVSVSMVEGDAANFVSKLRSDGYRGPILLPTVSFAGAFLSAVPPKDDTNINVIEESWPLEGNQAVANFGKQYQAKYNIPLDDNGVVGYEMAYFIKQVVEDSGILKKSMSTSAQRSAILSAIDKVGTFSSLGFTYQVDSGGFFRGPAQFLTITNGKVTG